jgi:hypothetical protein
VLCVHTPAAVSSQLPLNRTASSIPLLVHNQQLKVAGVRPAAQAVLPNCMEKACSCIAAASTGSWPCAAGPAAAAVPEAQPGARVGPVCGGAHRRQRVCHRVHRGAAAAAAGRRAGKGAVLGCRACAWCRRRSSELGRTAEPHVNRPAIEARCTPSASCDDGQLPGSAVGPL